MAKTLADMTAEERADCVGSWALIEGINLAIIAEADESNTCVVVYPQWDGDSAVHLNEMVAPRFDLPCAWTPDGEPELAQALAEETYEYAAQYKNDYTNGWKFLEELQGRWYTWETLTLWVEGNLHRFYDNIRIVRRRVSPVEVVND